MAHDDERDPSRDRDLGMDRSITRRDFLNGLAIGAGGVSATDVRSHHRILRDVEFRHRN